MAAENSEKPQKNFKDTLNLPRTQFPIRANALIDDPRMMSRWHTERLHEKAYQKNKNNPSIIIHDGPPYANGHIHLGHAYNKILKDIIAKFYRMNGYHVPVIPGWDCHGLPIEFRVSKEHPGLPAIELKKKCRAYANHWVATQKEEFQQLGVVMDWDHPYLTMSPSYEAATLHAFGILMEQGYIERKNKTVPWCMFCKTVLAAAEIEYEPRKDISLFVKFQLDTAFLPPSLVPFTNKNISFVVWTTTPWTLPLNRAVLLKPETYYVLLAVGNEYLITADALADKVLSHINHEKSVVARFVSDELIACSARALHPFIAGLSVPVLTDSMVSLDDGTACVHCAPGCGPQDYEVAIKHGLEIFSPINPDGTFALDIQPQELEGMSIVDAHRWVIIRLQETGTLFYKGSINHSYPHCWRCHNGLIFRATKQWFCDLEKHHLKERVLQTIETITNVPEKSKNRLLATVEGRLEWCLSRQRVWGVPIPALICSNCDYTYSNKALIDRVADAVNQEGIEYWDRVTIHELVGADFSCARCAASRDSLVKERDILDVWFDSGISHFAVLYQNPDMRVPADFYIEGKDQHRGWFQSSLLTSVILYNAAPMKTIITHGFVVDEHGRKMSKSIGNVVSPADMIQALGTDGLRLWVISVDYAGDAIVSEKVLNNVKEVFRKIRNTCRFLISNLYDFNKDTDLVPFASLYSIDQYALVRLHNYYKEMMYAYETFDLTRLFHIFADYCSVDLSAFYLDIVKDRLYVAAATGHERRCTQTALWYILDTLTRMMAPVLSFTAEQLSDEYQRDKTESIHLQLFPPLQDLHNAIVQMLSGDHNAQGMAELNQYEQEWNQLHLLRNTVLKEIELLREKGSIKHSLEAAIELYIDTSIPAVNQLRALFTRVVQQGQTVEQFLKELLIVSEVTLATTSDGLPSATTTGLYVRVQPFTDGVKCPRCWQWHRHADDDQLCARCRAIVQHR